MVVSACAGATSSEDEAGPQAASPSPATSGEHACEPFGPSESVTEAAIDEDAAFPWDRSAPAVLDGFDFEQVIRGGPPPDGIPAIDEPCFESLEAGDAWLEPQSPVLTVEVDGDARAYPLSIMTLHEIVNDVVGGEPLVVTYCPLCNSGLAFERTVEGQVLDFGTSGRLFQSNLVMYDRQTKALWIQFTGEAVVGEPWVGTELERLATGLLSWQEFKDTAPDGVVLSRDTGFSRDYGRNPYPDYDEGRNGFLFRGPDDDRLPPNTRVVGLVTADEQDATAVVLDLLRAEPVVEVDLGGEPAVVLWAPGAASALDAFEVDAGQDVGQTAAFRPFGPDGERLTFAVAEDDDTRFVDAETGSTWDLSGTAIAGPLEGAELEELPRDDTFWFVWFAFRPATDVVGSEVVAP